VSLDCADLVAVCDTDPERLTRIGRRFPGARRISRSTELLNDLDVEAVVIATPVSTHFELAREFLRHGKHVFVEKPLTRSAQESWELGRIAEAENRVLMPGHTFLYSPPVVLVKDMLTRGELGGVHYISMSRVNLGLHQPDASVLWDLAPHDFSILRYWLDDMPASITASGRACIMPAVHDVAFVDLEYPSGLVAHVEVSWLAPSKLRRTVIVGSEKMVVYEDTSSEPVRVFDSGVERRDPRDFGEYRLTYRTGSILSPHVEAAEPLALELADFCAAVRGRREPRSSWAIGHDVVGMIEAAEHGLITKARAIVSQSASSY
jgi:predicted dehydrogenase